MWKRASLGSNRGKQDLWKEELPGVQRPQAGRGRDGPTDLPVQIWCRIGTGKTTVSGSHRILLAIQVTLLLGAATYAARPGKNRLSHGMRGVSAPPAEKAESEEVQRE